MATRLEKAAAKMKIGCWYGSQELAEKLGVSVFEACQILQAIRRTPKLLTEEMKINGKVQVKLVPAVTKKKSFGHDTALVRLVVFGEPLPKRVSA